MKASDQGLSPLMHVAADRETGISDPVGGIGLPIAAGANGNPIVTPAAEDN